MSNTNTSIPSGNAIHPSFTTSPAANQTFLNAIRAQDALQTHGGWHCGCDTTEIRRQSRLTTSALPNYKGFLQTRTDLSTVGDCKWIYFDGPSIPTSTLGQVLASNDKMGQPNVPISRFHHGDCISRIDPTTKLPTSSCIRLDWQPTGFEVKSYSMLIKDIKVQDSNGEWKLIDQSNPTDRSSIKGYMSICYPDKQPLDDYKDTIWKATRNGKLSLRMFPSPNNRDRRGIYVSSIEILDEHEFDFTPKGQGSVPLKGTLVHLGYIATKPYTAGPYESEIDTTGL